ncbi:MAG: gamma-glutamyltransferase, partial [Gammaproteobacteria bacterium]|nr:gamma-glutamyltransferase [Gammaproteobacteria bacterium]
MNLSVIISRFLGKKTLGLGSLLLLLFFQLCCVSANEVHAKGGVVSTRSELASQAGVDVMQKGGNAIDAIVASAFALAVTYPSAGNLGG